ncbi:MAG: hypothetical protein ACREQ5_00915 [Candidatus Dormibacteria bacterium]
MSGSWGHAVGTLTVAQRTYRLYPRDVLSLLVAEECTTRGCGGPVTHWVGYRYVTGAQGRVATNWRKVCERHAQGFAVRWDVDVTTAPPPVSALDDAVTKLLEKTDR